MWLATAAESPVCRRKRKKTHRLELGLMGLFLSSAAVGYSNDEVSELK